MMRLAVPLLTCLLLAPVALANDAPEVRSFETRVLVDGTAVGDYGNGDAEALLLYDGGHDILAVDMREGYGPDLRPGLFVRLTAQVPPDADVGADLREIISFEAGGKSHRLAFETSDGATFTGDGFDHVGLAEDLGDGHMFAVEGFVSYTTLGVQPGVTITGVTAAGSVGGETRDVAPGTYQVQGQEVPPTPLDEDTGSATDYESTGPTVWLTARADIGSLTGSALAAPVEGTLTVVNGLADTDQEVELRIDAPAGITASADPATFTLAAGQARDVDVRIQVDTLPPAGHVKFHARSMIGGYSVATVPIVATSTGGDDTSIVGPDIEPGGTFQQTFTTVGTFQYHCHPHPWMAASISIEAAKAPEDGATPGPQVHTVRIVEPEADGDTWMFEPAHLSIHSGDTVVWINEGQEVHTVHGGIDAAHADHDHSHDHSQHDHGDEESDATTPPAPLIWLVAGLAVSAALRRK